MKFFFFLVLFPSAVDGFAMRSSEKDGPMKITQVMLSKMVLWLVGFSLFRIHGFLTLLKVV